MAITLLGTLVPLLWPARMLSALGASQTVAAVGADYLRLGAVAREALNTA